MKEYTLKQTCEMTGASRRAVQGYEELGMVSASGRNKYGHLMYDEVTLERIRIIKLYRDMGFSGKDVKKLMASAKEEQKNMIREKILIMDEEINRLERLKSVADRILHEYS